ncbi:Sodium/hydrogen exchanger family-domain-containing protein [Amylocarpus encephaloides]|uniref:Sodium/hydrogen exchanger family-domain-containing protein n=1 Tax=Amylocarpus encephaloides TaxID=45428 RepID=A0A9P7YQL0_9HELO|nr:Sodium/hydrogen exchanger family-domain-containing protein [Amylocarpus encephaloides]
MAWDHLSINKPHLVYIILGGFTSLFMLCSSFIKERLYIGEATVATICGIIFGPHAANLINPLEWGNTDQITLEFSRIVLVVQCFAVGVELPKYYMEKHWRSVVFLLIPVMTFGWLITSLFVWWMVLPLTWLESLAVSACVTATDPVLASSVVGKGKFAKRIPKHLRDILSAESGCNDGMAFPFIYLALYLIEYRPHVDQVAFHWIVVSVLYECVFGAVFGFVIGYIGRHGIKYAEDHDLVDRESFLVFYFVLALFCAGSGSILGVDDLLVGFAAGVGFSNDGWFTQKTEESHVSNVIDLLLNLAYFVYLGTIIPWDQYNNTDLGLTPWRLVVIAIFVIFFRRIPIMLALKPLIPDIKTWREALFAGHFGPIGVGAIFVAILARAELETETTTPLAGYPDPEAHNYTLVALIWPITTFLVIASIIVHGSSIAVFTLGKHINTLTLTMSYTTAPDGPTWMNRLPRISSTSRSQAKSVTSDTEMDESRLDLPPGTLPPIGMPGNFLRRQKEEDNPSRAGSRASSLIPRRKKKKWDDHGPGGPITQSAVYPASMSFRNQTELSEQTSETLTPGEGSPQNEKDITDERNAGGSDGPRDSNDEKLAQHLSNAERYPNQREVYDQGDNIVIENGDGDVISVQPTPQGRRRSSVTEKAMQEIIHPRTGYANLKKMFGFSRSKDNTGPEEESAPREVHKKHGPALAYQFGNTIIVEDEDGEVVKQYDLPAPAKQPKKTGESSAVQQGINLMGSWAGFGPKSDAKPEVSGEAGASSGAPPSAVRQGLHRMGTWAGVKPEENDEEDDRHIRFTIGGAGRRLTKDDFLKEIQSLDPKARADIINETDAPDVMKELARKDASDDAPGHSRLIGARGAQLVERTKPSQATGVDTSSRRGRVINDESDEDSNNRSPQARGTKVPAARMSSDSPSDDDMEESAAERRRREQTLQGIEEPERRGRSREVEGGEGVEEEEEEEEEEEDLQESAAERRRREAALGVAGPAQDDSDDDDTPRVPLPKSRGIRFAQSPKR